MRFAVVAWGLAAVVGVGCSDNAPEDASDVCPDTFTVAAEAATKVRIRNDSGVPIFIPDACPDSKPDGIFLDGASLFDPQTLWPCEDAAAGDCTTVPLYSCHNGADYQLSSGNALDVDWNGLVRAPTKMPVGCTEACNGEIVFSSFECGLATTPTAGVHQVSLTFSRGTSGAPKETVTVDVTFPTATIEILIGP